MHTRGAVKNHKKIYFQIENHQKIYLKIPKQNLLDTYYQYQNKKNNNNFQIKFSTQSI